MTVAEMTVDAGLHLFFFAFGLVSGIFVYWLDDYKRRGN